MARVLVIEDDAEIAVLIDRYLKRQGDVVVLAADGDVGIKVFAQGDFDIVVTDGLLPKKSGYEVAKEIRCSARGNDVGIIMMSAVFRGPQARMQALASGIDAFFAKPFVLTELRETILELVKKYGRVSAPRPASTPPADVGVPPQARAPAPAAVPSAAPAPAAPPPAAPDPPPAPVSPSSGQPAASVPAAVAAPAAPPRIRTSPPVAGALGDADAQARRAEAARAREPAPLGSHEQVRDAAEVARVLLRCARQGFSGIARFVDEQNQLQVAFLRGVIVGASDNLREHLLGERLWRQGRLTTEQMRLLNQRMAERNERVAEALLALALCTAEEAFQYVEEQALIRARRAMSWNGAVQFKEGEAEARAIATASIDVVDVIVGFALDKAQETQAARFIVSRAPHLLSRHPRFEELLLGFARVAPTARLPGALLAGQAPTVVDAARASSASETWAAWLAGLVVVEGDAEPDARPLPDVLRVSRQQETVDRRAAELVCATLLRARGRNHYEIVNLPRDATSAAVLERFSALDAGCGRTALEGKSLGLASSAARELWQILDEAMQVFSDDTLRAAYDLTLKPLTAPPVRVAGPEDAFLEGQEALAAGDVARARMCFDRAVEARSADPDYVSYLGWAEVLAGDRTNGVARLSGALRAHPQAMRPVFFLGMLAAAEGDKVRARALLEECARRSPDDIEVQVTMASLD